MRRAALAVLALALLAGCDGKVLVIESNTLWSGQVTGIGQIADSGSAEIDISDAPSSVCWTLTKRTSAGTLRAYLRDETWFGLGTEYDGDSTTSEPGGSVTGCNE